MKYLDTEAWSNKIRILSRKAYGKHAHDDVVELTNECLEYNRLLYNYCALLIAQKKIYQENAMLGWIVLTSLFTALVVFLSAKGAGIESAAPWIGFGVFSIYKTVSSTDWWMDRVFRRAKEEVEEEQQRNEEVAREEDNE